MNFGPHGRHRGFGPVRRLTGRQRVLAFLFLGVGGLLAAIAGPATRGGSVVVMGAIVILLMSVPLLRAAAAWGRRGLRAVRRLAGNRRRRTDPLPSGPPIEQLAYDLRRLLWRHDQLSRSSNPVHAKWLKPLEAAISSPAIKAARALDVPHQDPPPYNGLDTEELRRLLRALATEGGLVLPREVRLLAPGGSH